MSDQLLTQSAWWADNFLEGALLFRALHGGFFGKYPVFYIYLSYVLIDSLIAYCVFLFKPGLYSIVYWSSQFISVTIGCLVIWEIFRQVLGAYPGAARVARNVLAAIVVFVLCKVFLNAVGQGRLDAPSRNAADLERYLRLVQGALLLAVIALVAYYAIPIGRNLKGMILGYGTFIGLSVIQLELRTYLGDAFQPVWKHLGWVSYSTALLVWCGSLWSYHPSPIAPFDNELGYDYELMYTRTTKWLSYVRSSLTRTTRS